jgi:hypothetical protein
MSDVNQPPEGAEAWGRALEAAVGFLADDYEVDPVEVLAQEGFIALLDGTVGLDLDADAEVFAERVEEALAEWTESYAYEPAHAPAGAPGGGQFTTGGPGGGAKSTPTRKARTKGKGKPGAKNPPAAAKPAGPLGFDGKSGTGYDKPGGDPQVRELQDVVNKLGFKDAQGKPLARDGKFGPKTTTAVQAMQKALGLPTDGKVSPELLARVKSLAAKKKPVAKRARESEHVEVQRADRIEGRVLEAVGTDAAGGRVFRVRIIREGTSKNRKRYTEAVLRRAAPLYEGAKAYDHHRSREEMASSTLAGLVGGYRSVSYEAGSDGGGLYGDLHLFPSARHTAEALDASIAAQQAGLPPLVGISHDVLASFKAGAPGPRGHVQEAVAITRVHSADVVADPSAGGQAERVLAGGITATSEESDVEVTTEAVLDAFTEASDEQLAAYGLTRVTPAHTTEAAPVGEPKGSFLASLMLDAKLAQAGIPATVKESVLAALPERVTESDIDGQIGAYKGMLAGLERAGLAPTVTVQVTQEAVDKKIKALDAFFNGDFHNGYRSFRGAYEDFTGRRQSAMGGEDYNRVILRESFAEDYTYQEERATESMTASSWNLVLGDSVTRRLIAEYNRPGLDVWQDFVSSTPPVNDFRTQRIDRIGGYGLLPTVAQGAPYQPLTSPTNEEVTYALAKKGGTEDVTLEMIANDDVRAISKIPAKLGRAAARTLYLFVLELLRPSTGTYAPTGTAGNPTIYDSTALYVAGHANTTTSPLSQTALSVSRAKMRQQAAYGDAVDILGATPKYLLVPPTLEELGFQLVTSAVAVPGTPAGPSDTPNIHRGLELRVIDYWDGLSTTQWAVIGDPNDIPTIEIGFYQGKRMPEMFQQSDPTVGSMFNADKFTWKIRHIYSGAILDYRGFQRGNS